MSSHAQFLNSIEAKIRNAIKSNFLEKLLLFFNCSTWERQVKISFDEYYPITGQEKRLVNLAQELDIKILPYRQEHWYNQIGAEYREYLEICVIIPARTTSQLKLNAKKIKGA